MWYADGTTIQMAEEDYGINLPVVISGTTLGQGDSIKIVFKKTIDGETILEKQYADIQNNTVNLAFTQAESALFPIGRYAYRLDWYQDGNFMCNIIPAGSFKVVNKA